MKKKDRLIRSGFDQGFTEGIQSLPRIATPVRMDRKSITTFLD